MNTKEIQKYTLEILEVFHNFCEENNLRYSIFCGTLLGAVRHKGFIPWDDDIDIIMPREDFEKFMELTKDKDLSDHLFTLSYRFDKNYRQILTRVCTDKVKLDTWYFFNPPKRFGLWIDIFVANNAPNNPFRRKIYEIKNFIYFCLMKGGSTKPARNSSVMKVIAKKILYIMQLPFSKNLLQNYDKFIQKYNNVDCDSLWVQVMRKPFYLDKNCFDNISLYDFENIKVNGFSNYDELLTRLYGDYMTLPPENKRHYHNIDTL